jgi:riboflavin kinase/FMN adenylyltransferase
MVICKNLNTIAQIDTSVLTIGTFDGMHLGHMKVINAVKILAETKNIPSVVITFDPHPKSVINIDDKDSWNIITSVEKKLELLEENGIDYVWLVPFDKDFGKITASDFMDNYIIKYFNPEDIIVGYDHHFGNKREGNAKFLQHDSGRNDYILHIINPLQTDSISVSSTCIRECLMQCDIERANKLLGWDYELSGKVVKGSGIGNKINFPTANINPDDKNQLIPGRGAYCVEVLVKNKLYQGMCNIGIRPTLYDNGENVIEVHLITEDTLTLLNEKIRIAFKSFIRKEKKYENTIELAKQLELDRQLCISI